MRVLRRQCEIIMECWDGDIDFSNLSIESYQYIKSTYSDGIASALITEENIEIINKLIPLFNKKEGKFSRFYRYLYEKRGKDKELASSYLFRLYCNGFTLAYKIIDSRIKKSTDKLTVPSVNECKMTVSQYIKHLNDRKNCPTLETKDSSLFRKYLLALGEQEGATVRFLEYEKESKQVLDVDKPIRQTKRRRAKKQIKTSCLIVNLAIGRQEGTKENFFQCNKENRQVLEGKKPEQQKPGRKKKQKELSELFTQDVISKETIIKYIFDYISENNLGKDYAYIRIALEELGYTNKMEHEEYYRALCLQFEKEKVKTGSDAIRNAYNKLLKKGKGEKIMAKDISYNQIEIEKIKVKLIALNSTNSENKKNEFIEH